MALDERNIQTLRDGLKEINEASTKVRNSSELLERLQTMSNQCDVFKTLLANAPNAAVLSAYWRLMETQVNNARLFLDTKGESVASTEIDRLVKAATEVQQNLAGNNLGLVKTGVDATVEVIGAAMKVCQTVSNRELTNIWLISDRLLHT
jgi:hypothetical protein